MSGTAPGARLETLSTLLRARATRHAWIGLGIAVAAIVLATLLACLVAERHITFEGLIRTQRDNPALWLLDLMPFLFLLFGQYTGTVLAYQAGAMLVDETQDLATRAAALEQALSHAASDGPRLDLPRRDELLAELRRAMGAGGGALLVLDTDLYSELRETAEDEAADELVAQCLRRLQIAIGSDGLLAHLGHDEFAILVRPPADRDLARAIAARVVMAFDHPLRVDGRALGVRIAIGIAPLDAGDDAGSVLRAAETAKFSARGDGQPIMLWHRGLRSERAEQLRLAAELHDALLADGLQAEFVPQRTAPGRTPLRLRLQAYWPHPRRGRIDEPELLSLCDSPALTTALTTWLLREGMAWYAPAHRAEAAVGLVLRLPDGAIGGARLTESALRLAAAHDLPPGTLTLGFSESALMRDPQASRVELALLAAEGIGSALLGFGAPGASPATLSAFALREAHLAPGVLAAAGESPRTAAMLRHCAQIAAALDVGLAASGVHTAAELALAHELDCLWLEGPMIGMPVPATELPAALSG